MAEKRKKTGGRVKGTPNANTTLLKDMILASLSGAGGQAYLIEQATKNPAAYLTLVGKVLPLQINDKAKDPTVPTAVIHEHVVAEKP